MANKKQLAMLKKSVTEWNAWRKMNPQVEIDLSGANLFRADLRGAGLSVASLGGTQVSDGYLIDANLVSADLKRADLREVDLRGAFLRSVDFRGADLGAAILHFANFYSANLADANLTAADLQFTTFDNAKLNNANLSNTRAWFAHFDHTELEGAVLNRAELMATVFADVDLSRVNGLEGINHQGPSTIGIDTIYKSKGKIPEEFLRGCGVPDTFIAFARSLVGTAIEFYSCFISYSSKDEEFAKRLYADLQSNGVRCWFAPEDLKIGDKFRSRIDEAIRIHDKLLLVLSENSINSTWVENEVEAALEKEAREKKTVLFPIRLDDAVMETNQAWAANIRRTRHIGEMVDWKNPDSYPKAFERLLRDLKEEKYETREV